MAEFSDRQKPIKRGIISTVQQLLGAVFHATIDAFNVVSRGFDGSSYPVIKTTTTGVQYTQVTGGVKVSVIFNPVSALQASGIRNSAGSATMVAASAGITRKIYGYDLNVKADNVVVFLKSGNNTLTPRWKFKDGGGVTKNLTVPIKGVAGSAIKMSALAASAVGAVQYR